MTKFTSRRLVVVAGLLAAITAVCVVAVRAQDSDVLWKLVHDRCLQNEQAHNDPAPCVKVDLAGGPDKGFAVVKDLDGATQFLLIPTARITGIEGAALLDADATNYFADAWEERGRVGALAPRALQWDEYSLAINSISGRTQNQLHIHIDCINQDARKILKDHQAEIGAQWAPLDTTIFAHRYWAIRVNADAGQGLPVNPFRLLADGVPGAKADMGAHTLVVAGETFSDGRNGFIILDDHTDILTDDIGSGEELQDHSCSAG